MPQPIFARGYQSFTASNVYNPPYQPVQRSSTTPQQQSLQAQHSSTTPQRYAPAPSSQQPIYPSGSAPPATYDSPVYQPQYQVLPVQQNSTSTQGYSSAPSSHTYFSNPYQPQYQSTSLQNTSTVPSDYQYLPQSSYDSAPQPHDSSTAYQPLSSSHNALADGSAYALGFPTSGVLGLPSTVKPDAQHESTFQTNLPQQAPHLQANVPIESQELPATADRLASVVVQDGEEPQTFSSAKLITSYLRLFPEAENDQGCRVFKYGPKCSSKLLLPLFQHFDFPRYALFPYGFANDFVAERTPNAGICRCQRCTEDRPCGHYVLQHHFHFYLFQNTSKALMSEKPRVTADTSTVVISSRSRYIYRELLI